MFFCFLETKWPLVFLCCFLFAKNWILLQLPTRTFYENVNYDSICKKKKGILKCKANPFFPHQCFDLRDVIFLFDFSKLFLCLLSLVDETHLCNCGCSKRTVVWTSRGPQVALILPCFPRPVEQVFTLCPNKLPAPPWLKHWGPDQISRCRRHVWPACL